MLGYPESAALWQRATARIVGGVNSPSRHYGAVGLPHPVFMARAQGAYLWDVDGNRYIDYLAAFGPGILGHAHPQVAEAICRAAAEGTLYGTPTPWEVELAERLHSAMPMLEKVRFVNSGTEAVMSAVRVARALTGRHKLIKFAGCYHGHSDFALIKAGSGPATLGLPDSAGIPPHVAADVITVPYNDPDAFTAALAAWGMQVAAVLVEPIVGNFGIVEPQPGFLPQVEKLTRQAGALLIADEVITGFRFHYGAAQTLLGISADLTCLGKALGGGTPIGAYGGRAAVMDQVAPLGPAYQAGTMAGNPLSMRAGLAALDVLAQPGVYADLDRKGKNLAEGVLTAAATHGLEVQLNRVGSAFALYFTDQPVQDYGDAGRSDAGLFARFFREMLSRGILLAPSRYEAWFVQMPHSDDDISATIAAADEAFAAMSRRA